MTVTEFTATDQCDESCWSLPECAVCHRSKKPLGRDAPLSSHHCDTDCPGYRREPFPGHLWPSESPRSEMGEAMPDVVDGLQALCGVER